MSVAIPEPAVTAARLARLQREVPAGGALLAVDQANVLFATGRSSMAETVYRDTPCWALVAGDGVRLVAASIEVPALLADGVDPELLVPYGRFELLGADAATSALADSGRSIAAAVAAAAEALDVAGPVVADLALPAAPARALERALGREVACDGAPFERARAAKDDDAIARLERANRLAETAIAEALAQARAGTSERELAARVIERIGAGGGLPTLHVVGVGERSALPEAWPTARALAPGELIRFDVGCTVDGWHADISRTAVCGEPDAWSADAYAAILAGQDAALAAIRPDVPVREVHATAVAATRAAGLSEFERAHCGHGIGLNVYEGFTLAPGNPAALEERNVLCVETPHYDLVRGGVQVEDAVLVTPGGCRLLGELDRGLLVVRP